MGFLIYIYMVMCAFHLTCLYVIEGSVTGALSCSHSRAHDYFIESINSPCNFYAHLCSSLEDFDNGRCMGCSAGGCAVMGYDADMTSLQGALYLSTSNHSPYCGMVVILNYKHILVSKKASVITGNLIQLQGTSTTWK